MTDRGRPPASGMGRDDLLTEPQRRAIYLIGREIGYTEAEVEELTFTEYGRPPADLSKQQAGTMISKLQRWWRAGTRPHLASGRNPTAQTTAREQKTPSIEKALEEAGFKRAHAIEGNQAHAETWLREDGASIFVHWRGRIDGS